MINEKAQPNLSMRKTPVPVKLFRRSWANDFRFNRSLYLLMFPVIAFYVIFHYVPMAGIIIAFQDFTPMRGMFGSDFVGFANFLNFFDSFYFLRILTNTLVLSLLSLFIEFPAAIVFALLVNEIRSKAFAGVAKTISYLPHFVSLVVVCGIVVDFTSSGGVLNDLFMKYAGYDGRSMLNKPELFRPIFITSGLWQQMGWDSIIYLAAIAAVDQEQYEAAWIDGAGRWRQLLSVTLPGILSIIVVMLIMRVGRIMSLSFEKVILLYNSVTYETADVISSFVYRKGLIEFDWGYSTAVGLFNSLINLMLIWMANRFSKKMNETSIW